VGFLLVFLLILSVGAFDSIRSLQSTNISTEFSLDLTQLGTVLAIVPLGYVCSGPVLGRWIEKSGAKRVLFVSVLGLLLAVGGIVLTSSYALILALLFVTGFCKGGVEISLNVITASAFTDKKARYLSILHAGYGMGSFIFPMICGVLYAKGFGWRGVYIIFIGLFVIAILATPFLRNVQAKAAEKAAAAADNIPFWKLLRNKRFLALLLATVFFVGTEVGILGWAPYYLENIRAIDKDVIPFYIGSYFVLMMIGGLVGGGLGDRIGYERTVLLTGGLGVASLIALQLSPIGVLPLFALIGLGFSIVFPMFIAIGSKYFPEKAGMVIGYLTTAAGLGAVGTSQLMGLVGKQIDFSVAFMMPILSGALLLLVMLLLLRGSSRVVTSAEA